MRPYEVREMTIEDWERNNRLNLMVLGAQYKNCVAQVKNSQRIIKLGVIDPNDLIYYMRNGQMQALKMAIRLLATVVE